MPKNPIDAPLASPLRAAKSFLCGGHRVDLGVEHSGNLIARQSLELANYKYSLGQYCTLPTLISAAVTSSTATC